jgi:hypothetical protein
LNERTIAELRRQVVEGAMNTMVESVVATNELSRSILDSVVDSAIAEAEAKVDRQRLAQVGYENHHVWWTWCRALRPRVT